METIDVKMVPSPFLNPRRNVLSVFIWQVSWLRFILGFPSHAKCTVVIESSSALQLRGQRRNLTGFPIKLHVVVPIKNEHNI